ncbi:hypothetical protein SEPCBS57363_006111 [Sporothrix epigloea]|uniref:BZIP domain-containing protein n=1 Tax=Sporothrix epigloea TaxID=1892477 RepID=A0ABP0E4E7_9PEZI
MSQQASLPRPPSHPNSSSEVEPLPISPKAATALPRAIAVPSPSNRLPNEQRWRPLHQDERHDMQPAEEGDTAGNQYTARHGDDAPRITGFNSYAGSNVNSPRSMTRVGGLNTGPRTIVSAMDSEGEAEPADNSLSSIRTAPPSLPSIMAAITDDRQAVSSAVSRTLGVQNILNPSEVQEGLMPSPSTSLRGTTGSDLEDSRPLPRMRPSSANSPRMQPLHTIPASHYDRLKTRPSAQAFAGFTSRNSSSHHQSFSGRESVQYGPGYGQPTAAADSKHALDPTTRDPGVASVQPSRDMDSEQEISPQTRYAHPAASTSFGPPPRRILTPKPPRRSSLGRSMPGMVAPGSQKLSFPRGANTPPIPPVPPLPASVMHQSISAPDVSLGPLSGADARQGSGSGQTPGFVPGSYFPSHASSFHSSGVIPERSPQRSFTQPYYSRDADQHGDGRDSQSQTPEAQPTVAASYDSQQQQQQQDQIQEQQQDREPPPLPYPSGHRSRVVYGERSPPNKLLPASSPKTTGYEGLWSSQGSGRSLSMSGGQQFITITPSFGEEIHVPVDLHQASKQADEKRLRNAGASARFRARKKEKDREAQLGIQRLESANREGQKRIQELEVLLDFFRNERNRLRNIMLQTPGMREHVEAGPPSPVSSYGSVPFALAVELGAAQLQQQQRERQQQQSQRNQQPHPQQQRAQSPSTNEPHSRMQPSQRQSPQLQRSYPHQHTPTRIQPPLYPPMLTAPEHPDHPSGNHSTAPESLSSSMERPAQRRRTDSGPNIEYYTPSYTTTAPPPPLPSSALPSPLTTSLPPPLSLAGPSPRFHSMTPSPLGSPNNPRLPPLRFDTPGSNSASVGRGGAATCPSTPEAGHNVSVLPAPQHPPGTMAPSAYGRPYSTAGWAADGPSPHTQYPSFDSKHRR